MPMFGPTVDHGEIRRWAAVNGAMPVEVTLLVHDGEPSKIGFVFPGGGKRQPEFKLISWEGFFALFDVMELSFVYDDARPAAYELLQMEAKAPLGFSLGQS